MAEASPMTPRQNTRMSALRPATPSRRKLSRCRKSRPLISTRRCEGIPNSIATTSTSMAREFKFSRLKCLGQLRNCSHIRSVRTAHQKNGHHVMSVVISSLSQTSGANMSDATLLLSAVERGDPTAAERLLSLLYDELRRLATSKMAQEAPGQTLQPTALVPEAWLRLVASQNPPFENPPPFFSPPS